MVRFENVGLRYGLGPEILRDLTFQIPPRSFQFLTGPSGAGKTSLLRMLFLSLRPTRGLINLFGNDSALLDRMPLAVALRRHRAAGFPAARHLTTYENVALPFGHGPQRVELPQGGDRPAEMGRLGKRMEPCRRSVRGESRRRDRRAVIARRSSSWPTSPPQLDPSLARRCSPFIS